MVEIVTAPALSERLDEVRGKIEARALRCNRAPDEITLVAVSKTHPAEIIREAIAGGVTDLGENRVQEAESKIPEVGRRAAHWHLIGHLQSNKARRAIELFDVIHSLDSAALAQRLNRMCAELNRPELPVMIQVDLGREAAKSGVAEAEFFRKLRELRDELSSRGAFGGARGELSMGMTHDYEIAIEEGATIVRVGTAIFGAREKL